MPPLPIFAADIVTADAVRLAIIGAGLMGEQVATAADGLPGVIVAAVVDLDRGRAEALAERFGAAAPTSLDEIAAAADAVYIGAPSRLHAPLCVQAASQGLHILVDKPMCLSTEEADRIRVAIDEAQVHLMVGFSYRYRREWTVSQQWVEAGEIGRPVMLIDTIFEASGGTPAWYWDLRQGGGVTQLQAHHAFDRAAWLLDDEIRVTAAAANAVAPAAETSATILAQGAKGAIVAIALGFSTTYSAAPEATLLLQGSDGHILIDSVARTATLTTRGSRAVVAAGEDDWLGREVCAFVGFVRGDVPANGVPGWSHGAAAVRAAEATQSLIP